MASIDSLNFEVILNDTNFRNTIAADKKLAQSFNTELTKFLSVRPRVLVSKTGVDNASQLLGYLTQIQSRMANMPKGAFLVGDANQLNATLQQILPKLDQMIAKTGSAKAGFAGMNSTLSGTNALMRTLSQLTGAAFSVVGIRRFLSSLLDITGQFEVQRMALRNMLQDVDGADKIFEDLYRFSSDSTYRFSELAKYAKQLAAFNIDKNGLLETTKMLGDVASGVGVSMDRLILAYGHVKSSGFLRGIQLRSFSQNGVPVLDELAKMFSELEHRAVSLGEVFDKMTKREIPFEMVEQAFKNMTSEGGKFYQMQEVLAKTLAGQMNILKGRWENMLAALGQANSGPIKDMVAGVSNLIANYENVGRVLKELIITFGAYKAALFVVTAVSEGLFAASFNLLLMLEKIEAAILANPYALLAAAIAAAGYALYKFNNYMTDAEKITQTASEGIDKYEASLAAENMELDRLFAKLKLAKEGTEEYDKARLAIENRFGPYLQQIRAEQGQIENLADTYQLLADKIKEAQKAKFLESESDAMLKAFNNASNNIYESFKKTAEVNKWSIDQQEDIWRYIVTGELTNKNYQRNLSEMGGGTIGLPGTFLYKDMGRSAASLRTDFIKAAQAYDEGMSALEDVFGKRKKAESGGGKDDADALVYKIASIVEGIKKYDADIAKLRDKAKSVAGITADEKGQLDQLVESRKEQADLYKSIMGIDYDKDTRKGESAAEKARKKSISDLKTDIALLEKYLSIYQKIEPIKGENTAKWMSENIGGKPEDYANLESQIESLCASLRQLGDEGNAAADAIEARLGLDAASQLVKLDKEAKKAADDFEKAEKKITDYLAKDFGVEGERTAAKISKLIKDTFNLNAGVDSNYKTLVAELEKERQKVVSDYIAEGHSAKEADAYWDEYKTRREKELKEKAAQEKAQNNAVLKERVRALAKNLLNEQMEGFDLTNWTDKTIAQINDIKSALESVDLPQELRESLKENYELAKLLLIELKKLAGEELDNTVLPELDKAWAKNAQSVAKYLGQAADAMKELGEATGNSALSDAASAASAISETLSAAAAGFQAGGVWGAVIAGALDIITQIIGAVSEAEAKAREMRDRIREIRYEMAEARFNAKLEIGVEGIFGENFVAKVKDSVDAIREAESYTKEMYRLMQDYHRYVRFNGPFNIWGLLDNEKGHAVIKTNHSFWNGDTWTKLEDIAKDLNMELYGEGGFMNPEFIEKVISLYGDLNENALDWLYKEKEAAEEYNAAIQQIRDATTELFNSLSSDMTDKFIENFREMGNAVNDLGDVFTDLGETILQSLLNSYILDNILKKYEDEANEMLRSYAAGETSWDDYAEWLNQFTENVKRDSENQADAINGLISAFADRGLINMDTGEGSESSQSLGQGIKSITEETASLLASYINAMRADLSFMRSLQEQGWSDVAILGAFIPTLNDYLQQIAANTFDAAQHTASILSELQAVIGAEGSTGMIVRVQMA